MSKKIVVVEDSFRELGEIVKITREAGYETLSIFVSHLTGKIVEDVTPEGTISAASAEQVIELIKDFNPDVILLDHDLGSSITGEQIAVALGASPEKLVGISLKPELQPYCKQCFPHKQWFTIKFDEDPDFQLRKQELLTMIEVAL